MKERRTPDVNVPVSESRIVQCAPKIYCLRDKTQTV